MLDTRTPSYAPSPDLAQSVPLVELETFVTWTTSFDCVVIPTPTGYRIVRFKRTTVSVVTIQSSCPWMNVTALGDHRYIKLQGSLPQGR
jgi:hypothetical protein